MTQDDPFASLPFDRTIAIPAPGQRAKPAAPLASALSPPPAPAPEPATLASLPKLGGINPLIAAASPLLNLVPQLRVASQPNPGALREALVQGIKKFDSDAKTAGIKAEHVVAARYVLCTFLDETAGQTPWGGSGAWAKQSLLVTFHNETWGGEKVFQLLAKLAQTVPQNRDLLELIQVCLGLGFRGRYSIVDGGQAQLDTLRERLAQMLLKERGEPEKELSPQWRGADVKTGGVLTMLPMWVIAAIVGLLLIAIYLALNWRINRSSDPIFTAIESIRAPIVNTTPPPPPKPALTPRLATFLAPEIAQGLVAVQDFSDRSVITIAGDGFFEPGSATVDPKVLPLLKRIAAALNGVPGRVTITGHTDNQPIRSARFPSNWHLSQARAESVRSLLAADVAGDRMRADGEADAKPVAPNDTPANRARNRRVEITLFSQGGGT